MRVSFGSKLSVSGLGCTPHQRTSLSTFLQDLPDLFVSDGESYIAQLEYARTLGSMTGMGRRRNGDAKLERP